jgi:hypothetical protein
VWRRGEAVLDRETMDGIIRLLMRIDAKVDEVLREVRDEEEEDA